MEQQFAEPGHRGLFDDPLNVFCCESFVVLIVGFIFGLIIVKLGERMRGGGAALIAAKIAGQTKKPDPPPDE